jgi:hypothetical protein
MSSATRIVILVVAVIALACLPVVPVEASADVDDSAYATQLITLFRLIAIGVGFGEGMYYRLTGDTYVVIVTLMALAYFIGWISLRVDEGYSRE